MSMADCDACWDLVCECGWRYRHYSREARLKLAQAVIGCSDDYLAALEELIPAQHPLFGFADYRELPNWRKPNV